MKKLLILGLCALTGAAALAQADVVKEAERAMKKKTPYQEVVKMITPAFTDPATSQQALTYYVPGKSGFNQYDELFSLKAMNRLPENGAKTMSDALLGGYEYFVKALPLDSLPDEKGKVKPKYSKDIVNVVAGHYHDFNSSALEYWNLKEYDKAYKAWQTFIDITYDPLYTGKITVPNDTLMGEIMYNQALAAWQSDNLPATLAAFMNAKKHHYNKKNLYEYAIAVATGLKDDATVTALATEAQEIYGKEDSGFIGYVINGKLNEKKYDEALALIDQAIAANPQNAQYYVIKGILLEQDEIKGDAKGAYAKAVELDPYNAQAQYNYGRMFYNEAMIINDAAPADDAAYSKIYYEQVKPLLLKSVEILENSANLKEDYTDPLKLLENAYYLLKDEAGMKSVQDRLNK